MPKKLLMIDDAADLLKVLQVYFVKQGFQVVSAADGSSGLLLARETLPDLVVTDAAMPGIDGHSLCRILKKDPATSRLPVIIMSGDMTEEKDVVAGLEGGADDYVLKPFSMNVLSARVNCVLRRYAQVEAVPEALKSFGVELAPEAREVRVNGARVPLSRKEFDLLSILMEKRGRLLKTLYLLETVWGYDTELYSGTHTVETHIFSLRRKLGPRFAKHITNVRGYGYKLEA